MSDTIASLRRKIGTASDLHAVVRSMKALAASSIGQYDASVRALGDYCRAVELGLGASIRAGGAESSPAPFICRTAPREIRAIVFGTDQGLVGQFNGAIAAHAVEILTALPGMPRVWAVGERVQACLIDAGLTVSGLFSVPTSVKAVAPLVGQLQVETEADLAHEDEVQMYVFHNRPKHGSVFEPSHQRLLPLDADWRRKLAAVAWPTTSLPEVMGRETSTLRTLIHEFLFISLYRACAESLASENAGRLAAMQRAEKNIDDLLEKLHGELHHLRQSSIDEELFDLVSGYEALK